jgi:hypothetical protein
MRRKGGSLCARERMRLCRELARSEQGLRENHDDRGESEEENREEGWGK